MKINATSIRISGINIVNLEPFSNKGMNITMSHNISHPTDNESCVCTSIVNIVREDENDNAQKTFLVSITVTSAFTIEGYADDQEELQHMTIREVFPHLRSAVSSSMAIAGIEPLFLSSPL